MPKETLAPRIDKIVEQYGLDATQTYTLNHVLGAERPDKQRISSYFNLHQHLSRNFAQQLTQFCTKTPATADDVRDMGLLDGGEKDFYKVVLTSKVDLPEGLSLLPGEFVQNRVNDTFVRGTLEIQNQTGKSIGIRFSRVSGSDSPVFFVRETPEAKPKKVDWDHDGGPRMDAISDMWIRPQGDAQLSCIEKVVIGLMQEKNKRASQTQELSEKTVEDGVNEIRSDLAL